MIPGIVAAYRPIGPSLPPETDPSFASVGLLLHFDGGNGSTDFTEVTGKVLAVSGGAVQSSTQKLFGVSSMTSPAGTYNQRLQTESLSSLNLSGPFTIELALYLVTSTIQYFVVARGNSTLSINTSSGKLQVFAFGTTITHPDVYTQNQFLQIAVTRDASNVVRLFVGGIQKSSASTATNQTTTTVWDIGSSTDWGGASTGLRDGYMDELRVTFGVCRYSSAYTPANSAFPDA